MIETVRSGRYEIPILYEDNHLLVAVKPNNLPSQADSSRDDDMLGILKGYIGNKYHKPGKVYLGLVHRLDRPVGGVMVFARTSKAAARLCEAFSRHAQARCYLAVVRGTFESKRTLEDWLFKGKDGMVRVVRPETSGAKLARLTTAPLACRDGLTLLKVTLFTGRSHQIRVQHAHAGFPLWGDNRYGGGKPGEQIALWAHQLCFEHPTKREPLSFCSLPPNSGAWTKFYDAIEDLD